MVSSVNLVLLGMVLAQPQSAYDIHKQIQYRNLGQWVKVGKATVFKNLSAMEQKGWLQGEPQQSGNAPAKTVYQITAAGRSAFGNMMQQAAAEDIMVHFPFNAVVANLNKVPLSEALEYTAALRNGLQSKLDFIEAKKPQREHIPFVGHAIMRQQTMVLATLLCWLDEFETELKQETQKPEV